MIDTILVATDGSLGASGAEAIGFSLASRLRAGISGCTVIEDRDTQVPDGANLGGARFPETELQTFFQARAEATVRRFVERGRASGVEATCEATRGVADERLIERAQAADLLLLGRTGKSSGQRSGLGGATLEAVLRKSSKSSLIVPEGAVVTGPVLAGFDGSPGSRLAVKQAAELAARLGETLYVFVDSKDKARAIARFEEVRPMVAGLGAPAQEVSSTLGRPDVKLVDTAQEIRAGLLVMGAYGRNRITDFFLGSNAAAVVRTSPVAVLLAR
jgi:nucleotide-binding universal stress UspA family protein